MSDSPPLRIAMNGTALILEVIGTLERLTGHRLSVEVEPALVRATIGTIDTPALADTLSLILDSGG